MADFKYADRVAESTVTTGTGDINLAGAIDTDHATFSSQFTDGDLMPVSVFGGGKWMTFTARYNSGANSLTRVTFRRSSTGSNLSLSGTMTVMCGWGADDAAAVLRTDTSQSLNAASRLQAASNLSLPPQCGRLTYVSTTAIKFAPCNGDLIKINGSIYRIPAAGIAGVANTGVYVNGTVGQNLGASTFYYVYAMVVSGVVTADFRTDGNGHMPDTTAGNEGIEVRVSTGTTPDPTRTLIGMVATNASSQFQQSSSVIGVVSWFNRRRLNANGFYSTARTLSNTSYVEINQEIRASFLAWNNETVDVSFSGAGYNSGATGTGASTECSIGIDGATPEDAYAIIQAISTGGIAQPISLSTCKSGLTEAQMHYSTFLAKMSSGSDVGTFYGNATAGSRCSIQARIMG